MENTSDNRELIEAIIQNNIANNDADKVESALILAKNLELPIVIRLKGHLYCGKHYINIHEYGKALEHLNISRALDPTNLEIAKSCLLSITGFYNQSKGLFSKDDLKQLSASAKHLLSSVLMNIPGNNELTTKLPDFIFLLDFESKYIAEDVEETKATFRVQQIYNSFYEPKTYQEVLENFAFTIEDDFREFLEKESEKPKKEGKDKTKNEEEKGKDDSQ